VRYRAVDVDGNVGLAKSCVVRIYEQAVNSSSVP